MARKACLTCGRSFTPRSRKERRCPAHQGDGTGWSHNRDRKQQAAFRAALRERAGDRCERVENGARCTVTDPHALRACHLVPVVDGGSYDPSNGELLCAAHDRESDPHAR